MKWIDPLRLQTRCRHQVRIALPSQRQPFCSPLPNVSAGVPLAGGSPIHQRSSTFHLWRCLLALLVSGLVSVVSLRAQTSSAPPKYPDPNTPWPEAQKKGLWPSPETKSGAAQVNPDTPWPEAEKKGLWPPPKAAAPAAVAPAVVAPATAAPAPTAPPTVPPPAPAQAATPPPAVQPQAAPAATTPTPTPEAAPAAATPTPTPETAAAAPETTTPAAASKPRKSPKNDLSASGDFFFGQGTITLPFGYSLNHSLGQTVVPEGPGKADRSSTYYGGTLSYSYGQQHAWYVDFSYSQGDSSGSQNINDVGTLGSLNSDFTLKDKWYQAYVRYTFPGLSGSRFAAYLRAGGTYVDSTLNVKSTIPQLGYYTQDTTSKDYMGNLGFGGRYSYRAGKWRLGGQLELEGFFGSRSQDSLETLPYDTGFTFSSVTVNNTIYGGIGRATLRAEYGFGSGLLRVFGEGGFQGKFTEVTYPNASSGNELLWGPYIKIGVRYAF